MARFGRFPNERPFELYFLTLVTREREARFHERDDYLRLWNSLQPAFRAAKADLHAFVFLPDHLHLLIEQGPESFARTVEWIKNHLNSAFLKEGGTLWQARYWDHRIFEEDEYREVCDAIHVNPVWHGRVKRPSDWPYSSFKECVKEGLYPEDWRVDPVPSLPGDDEDEPGR